MWQYNYTSSNTGYLCHASHKYIRRETLADGSYRYIYEEDYHKKRGVSAEKANANYKGKYTVLDSKTGKQVEIKSSDDIKKIMSEQKSKKSTSSSSSSSKNTKQVSVGKDALKKYNKVITDVMVGKYGNGEERKKKLAKIGLDYKTVQGLVNMKMLGKPLTLPQSSLDSLDKSMKDYKSPSVKSIKSSNQKSNKISNKTQVISTGRASNSTVSKTNNTSKSNSTKTVSTEKKETKRKVSTTTKVSEINNNHTILNMIKRARKYLEKILK